MRTANLAPWALLVALSGCTPPPPAADFSCSATEGDAPLRARFSDLSSGEVTSWRWDFGDGGSSDLAEPVYVYRRAGTFPVSLRVTGPGGTSTSTRSQSITVTGSAPRANVLVILADDLSVADLPCYGVDPDLPPGLTPNIDRLAAEGLLFDCAWGSPVCSAARAALLTGRYAFRTGIGGLIETGPVSLRPSELTLNEALERYADAGYAHAAFGKWHLECLESGLIGAATDAHGFDLFDGATFQVLDACNWPHLVSAPGDGKERKPIPSSTYMPEYLFDAASSWIARQSGPWFCYLAPQAPYYVLHVPPTHLQSQIEGKPCERCAAMDWRCFDAAVQAFDTKIGDLLLSLGPDWRDETTIIFSADEGSVAGCRRHWPKGQGKGSLYEATLRVPLIIAGRGVDPALRGTRTSALATLADIYRTVTDLAGATGLPATAGQDSVDLLPALRSPAAPAGRTSVFTEVFYPNALQPPYDHHVAAIRDQRFKLIYDCGADAPAKFFDLAEDPLELRDLLLPAPPAPGTPAGDALARLRAEITALQAN